MIKLGVRWMYSTLLWVIFWGRLNMGQGALHVNAMPKIRQVLQNTTPRVYMQMCNIGTPSSRPFLSLINFASTKSILFPDEIHLEFSIKHAKYFLNYMLPCQLLYDHTPVCQVFLKSTMTSLVYYPLYMECILEYGVYPGISPVHGIHPGIWDGAYCWR